MSRMLSERAGSWPRWSEPSTSSVVGALSTPPWGSTSAARVAAVDALVALDDGPVEGRVAQEAPDAEGDRQGERDGQEIPPVEPSPPMFGPGHECEVGAFGAALRAAVGAVDAGRLVGGAGAAGWARGARAADARRSRPPVAAVARTATATARSEVARGARRSAGAAHARRGTWYMACRLSGSCLALGGGRLGRRRVCRSLRGRPAAHTPHRTRTTSGMAGWPLARRPVRVSTPRHGEFPALGQCTPWYRGPERPRRGGSRRREVMVSLESGAFHRRCRSRRHQARRRSRRRHPGDPVSHDRSGRHLIARSLSRQPVPTPRRGPGRVRPSRRARRRHRVDGRLSRRPRSAVDQPAAARCPSARPAQRALRRAGRGRQRRQRGLSRRVSLRRRHRYERDDHAHAGDGDRRRHRHERPSVPRRERRRRRAGPHAHRLRRAVAARAPARTAAVSRCTPRARPWARRRATSPAPCPTRPSGRRWRRATRSTARCSAPSRSPATRRRWPPSAPSARSWAWASSASSTSSTPSSS